MPGTPFLSIIIPAHNEEHRLPTSLAHLYKFLAAQSFSAEVVVVENGSTDRTADIIREQMAHLPNLRLIQTSLRGKGLAVRIGMLKSSGEYRFLCDADFSMPAKEIENFLPPRRKNFDIAIGSREAKGARRIGEPAYRHLTGRMFSFAVKALILNGFEDRQCGFKCFRGPVAEDVFSRQRFNGWSFDVEVLYLARKSGYIVQEVPISWTYDSDSRIRLAGDSFSMFRDLLRIQWNDTRGLYDSPNPDRLSGT